MTGDQAGARPGIRRGLTMAAQQQGPRDATALDAADWLDVHFAACQPEYEALG